MSIELIPSVIVNPSSIVTYNQVIRTGGGKVSGKYVNIDAPEEPQHQHLLESDRKAKGTLSKIAYRKLNKAIDYMVATSHKKTVKEKVYGKTVSFQLAFITLTLPSKQQHSDHEITSQCLNQFLTEMKKKHNVSRFVWRAEKQANGNIHYHIIVNNFVPWNDLRNDWNRIVNKLGYVDRFQEKNGRKQPNSTDIHSTRKIRDLKNYISKYMSKTEEGREVSGRIWSCSHELSNAKGYYSEIDSVLQKELETIKNSGKVRIYQSDYFTVYNINFRNLKKIGAENLFYYFANYLLEHFNFNLQLSI